MPSLPLVVVEHPIGGLDERAVRSRALMAIPEVVRVLTTPRESLVTESKVRDLEPKTRIRAKSIFR